MDTTDILKQVLSQSEMNSENAINGLPFTSGRNAIAVGFEDETALKHLETILRKVFDKNFNESSKSNDENNKNQKKIIESFEKLQSKYEEGVKHREETNEIADAILKEQTTHHAEIKKSFAKFETYMRQAINITLTAIEKMTEAQGHWKQVARELESSGIGHKGYKDIVDSANIAGVSLENFSKALQSSSKNINRLTRTFGEGHRRFADLINQIGDDVGFSLDEKSKVVDYVLNTINDSEVMEMDHEILRQRIAESSKELKKMSFYLGVSTDELIRQQQEQNKLRRWKAFSQRHSEASVVLNSMNLSDDERDYIASGKLTSDLAIKMAAIPGFKAALDDISFAARTNKLNTETMFQISKKYYGYANARQQQVMVNADNRGGYAASAYNQNVETMLYDEGGGVFGTIISYGRKGNITESDINNRGGLDVLTAKNRNDKAINQQKNLETYGSSGGEEGIIKLTNIAAAINEKLKLLTETQINITKNWFGEGLWFGLSNSMAEMGKENVLKYGTEKILGSGNLLKNSKLGQASIDKFDKAVDKFGKFTDEHKTATKATSSILKLMAGVASLYYGKNSDMGIFSVLGNYLIGKSVADLVPTDNKFLKLGIASSVGVLSNMGADYLMKNPSEIKDIKQPKFESPESSTINNTTVNNTVKQDNINRKTEQYQDDSINLLTEIKSLMERSNLNDMFNARTPFENVKD